MIFFSSLAQETFCFLDVHNRSTEAHLYPKMINFDVVD